VWGSIWKVLLGQKYHTLLLPHPITLEITPTALAALVKLWGRLPLAEVKPEERLLVWEVKPGFRVPTRTDWAFDLAILHEIFVEKQYGEAFPGWRVLDIGAYGGESALYFVLEGAEAVAAVEPYPPAAEKAERLLAENGLQERVRLLRVAIGPQEGEGTLWVSEEEPQTNTLSGTRPVEAPAALTRAVSVPVWTFERLLSELGWETVDLAKLDCEGCEYAIFSSTPDSVLQRVKRWVMEFHGGGEPIAQRLRGLGYQVECQERPDKIGTLRAWLP